MPSLTWQNVAHRCSLVDFSAEPVVLNLSDVTFIEPFAVIYLGMFLRANATTDRELSVIAPASPAVCNYLSSQNFWERFNFDPESVKRASLRRTMNSTSLNDIIDIERRPNIGEEVSEAVLRLLHTSTIQVENEEIAIQVSELADNFAQHSGEALSACMIQCYPNLHAVRVAIGDCGIGIRANLSSVDQYAHLADQPHHETAIQAFEPLVTSKNEGGTGLTDIRDAIMDLGPCGHLVLATGDGYYRISRGHVFAGRMQYDLSGVQVELTFYERG
jgi:anti-sigma regulatory factor (Ser/Thr protein kinase)